MSQTGKVTASVLNFRPEPSTRRPPLGQLKRGDLVKIVGRAGNWYKIQSGDKTGYVYGNFLEIQDDLPFHQFLFEQEALRIHPLEPSSSETIEVVSDFSRNEKQVARTWNHFGGLIQKLSEVVDIDPGSALAVLVVESSGRGFSSDGRMIIRFENHKFLKYYGKNNPDTFKAHFKYDQNKRWLGHQFRKSPTGTLEKIPREPIQRMGGVRLCARVERISGNTLDQHGLTADHGVQLCRDRLRFGE